MLSNLCCQTLQKLCFRFLTNLKNTILCCLPFLTTHATSCQKNDTNHYLLLHNILSNMYTIYECLFIGVVFTHACVQYILLHSNGPLVHKIASMSLMCQQQNFLPSFCKIQWPCSCKYHHKIVFSVQILVDVPVFNVHKPISENKS